MKNKDNEKKENKKKNKDKDIFADIKVPELDTYTSFVQIKKPDKIRKKNDD